MCVKLPPRDLNPDPYPPHLTSVYTCEVTTTPRVQWWIAMFLSLLTIDLIPEVIICAQGI